MQAVRKGGGDTNKTSKFKKKVLDKFEDAWYHDKVLRWTGKQMNRNGSKKFEKT